MAQLAHRRAFRLSVALGSLCVVTFFVVPLIVSCVGLELDAPVSRVQVTSLSRWSLGLLIGTLWAIYFATRQLMILYPPRVSSRTDVSILIFAICAAMSIAAGVAVREFMRHACPLWVRSRKQNASFLASTRNMHVHAGDKVGT